MPRISRCRAEHFFFLFIKRNHSATLPQFFLIICLTLCVEGLVNHKRYFKREIEVFVELHICKPCLFLLYNSADIATLR